MKKKLVLTTAVLVLALCAVFAFAACNTGADDGILFGRELLRLTAQVDILQNLDTGTADIGIMDSVMAGHYLTHGSYEGKIASLDLFEFPAEEYGIGAKKGNDALVAKINEGLIALAANGTLGTIAAEYGLQNEILVNGDTENPKAGATDDSWNNVVASGSLVIGYTVFEPIAYREGGELTGFDVELAEAVVDHLNAEYDTSVEIEWIEIEWSTKQTQLENGSLDLVWNGMTLTDEVMNGMSTTVPYLANRQTLIVRSADADKYADMRSFFITAKDAVVAVESGSAADLLMTVETAQ